MALIARQQVHTLVGGGKERVALEQETVDREIYAVFHHRDYLASTRGEAEHPLAVGYVHRAVTARCYVGDALQVEPFAGYGVFLHPHAVVAVDGLPRAYPHISRGIAVYGVDKPVRCAHLAECLRSRRESRQ